MTNTERTALIATIDRDTNYDASTVIIHRDGTISAILDADKTFNGPETIRFVLGHIKAFATA